MRTYRPCLAVGLMAAALLLAGCKDGGGFADIPFDDGQDSLGTGFSAAFVAGRTAELMDPAAAGLALAPGADPFDL